ncbi:hypothetical protein VMT65_05565 [Nocardia sp. CDC153]|uniref:hypothetical protein n=1 Tax=Nocardia sp. CDC153 TaxID=3112167 RepID=UPI002DBD5E56|nr:hypothetical protein [Nocardia sp. CDC153]MEC3952495.1 hypothetical protein [Nocardia sp. CDC153]
MAYSVTTLLGGSGTSRDFYFKDGESVKIIDGILHVQDVNTETIAVFARDRWHYAEHKPSVPQ